MAVRFAPRLHLTALLAALGIIACGGAGDGGTTAPPVVPPTPVVTTVTVLLASATIEAGATTTATAAVLDQNGAAIAGKTVAWSTDNALVATVSPTGVVTGVANGNVNIVATVDGKSGQRQASIVTSSKWVVDATIFTNADFGGMVGSLANSTVLRLTDGRYRMYFTATPDSRGMVSAISTDGMKFSFEPGVRLPLSFSLAGGTTVTLGQPNVLRLADGRVRIFMRQHPRPQVGVATGGIYSLTSTDDGQTFTIDPGIRLTSAAAGVDDMSGCAIVTMKSGGWRMYFSDNPLSTTLPSGFVQLGTPKILSAFSPDLVTWTMDPGVRIGPGAPVLTSDGFHPGAIANDDGSITLLFVSGASGASMFATSADGLAFTSEAATGFGAQDPSGVLAGDPFLLRLDNGDVRMFYNWGDDKFGKIYTAHRSAFSLNGK